MSFIESLDGLSLTRSALVRRFADLIAPKSDAELEKMGQASRALTLQNFGRTMRLFAPLYLSNECINNCRYCGFSRDNPILRVTLSVGERPRAVRLLGRRLGDPLDWPAPQQAQGRQRHGPRAVLAHAPGQRALAAT